MVIKIPAGVTTLYFELNSRRPNIVISEVNLRFKEEDDKAPELLQFSDIIESYSNCSDVLASYGKTIKYVHGKTVYGGKKFYYGIKIDAPREWSGKISFMFSTRDLGRRPARKSIVVR